MRSEHYIALFLILSLAIFAIWDVYLYIKGKTTLSRYVIKKKTESLAWRILAIIFCTGVTLVGVWLFFHWELI